MNPQPKWSKNENLLIQIAQNFKQLEQQNIQLRKQLQQKQKSLKHLQNKQTSSSSQKYTKDQQKILKLYSYKNWFQFMVWIDEKLEESGEVIQNDDQDNQNKENSQIKRVLSQILEQPDFQQSYTLQKPEQKIESDRMYTESQTQTELLAVQNAKLRRQNIQLKSKLTQIRALYMKNFGS